MMCKTQELRRTEKLRCIQAAAALINLGYNVENASEPQEFTRRVVESRRRLIRWMQLSGTGDMGRYEANIVPRKPLEEFREVSDHGIE